MGMQKKLERAYKEGMEEGRRRSISERNIHSYIHGCHDTWDIVDHVLENTKGIGPATKEKVIGAIRKHAQKIEREGMINK